MYDFCFTDLLHVWVSASKLKQADKHIPSLPSVISFMLSRTISDVSLPEWEKLTAQHPKLCRMLNQQPVVCDNKVMLFDKRVAKIDPSLIPSNCTRETLSSLKYWLYRMFLIKQKHHDPKRIKEKIQKLPDGRPATISLAHALNLPHVAQMLTQDFVNSGRIIRPEDFPRECHPYLAPLVEPTCKNLPWMLENYAQAIEAKYIINPDKCADALTRFIAEHTGPLLSSPDFIEIMQRPLYTEEIVNHHKEFLPKKRFFVDFIFPRLKACLIGCGVKEKESIVRMLKDYDVLLNQEKSFWYEESE